MSFIMTPKVIGIDQAAQYTGLAKQTIYKMVSHRRIPHIKLGGRVKFTVEQLDKWIAKNTVMPV